MKNTIVSMGLGMVGGMMLATYAMSSTETKKKAVKMLDDMSNCTTKVMNDAKNFISEK